MFGIGMLVFIHELGHFMMAKFFKLKVEAFAFGFGPEIFGFTYGETRYQLRAIPLGGMVKMPGEDIETSTGSPDEFLSQPWYKRLIIAFFGPLMNYLLAVVLFTIVIYFWGLTRPSPLPLIGQVMAGYPAATAGVQKDDKILTINDKVINTWEDMADSIHKMPGKEVKITVQRKEEKLNIVVIPKKDDATGYGLIGIVPAVEIEKVGLSGSVALSCKLVVYQSVFTLRYLGEKIVRWEKPELSGPIGVIHILADAAKTGLPDLLHLLAVISVALGLFNLLPIPLVDGGHIFTALIEFVIRRPIDKKIIQVSNFVGLALIVGIFIFATYSDIARMGLDFNKLIPK
jgi:regulator of sigma E protease